MAWRVPSLALPPSAETISLDSLAATETVRLFVERVVAVQPAFVLTADNAPIVGQICRRLDGIPLAIELAATRVKALAVEQIAVRLDQRFRLLTGGSRAALPRQQTLAALVGWSYDLLSEPERTVFDRLAVFAGGFTLEAAEAVCGDVGEGERETKDREAQSVSPARRLLASGDVTDLLTSLVDKSLVVTDVGDGPAGRYRLLETLRQYGRERLVAAGEAEALHRRHAAYYRDLVVEAETHLHRPEQLAYLARLDLERDNIRVALRWYLDGADAEGLHVINALFWYWWYRGLMAEGLDWHTQFLQLPGPAPRTPTRARALAWAGSIALMRGDIEAGRPMLVEGLAIARETGDDRTIAWVTLTASRWGGPDKVRWYGADDWDLAEGALARYRAAGDRWGIAETLAQLGDLAGYRGDPDEGRRLLTECLAVARTVGDRRSVALACEFLGYATIDVDAREAGAHLRESLRLHRELGNLGGVVSVQNLLGRLDCLGELYGSAREHYRASLRVTRDWAWMLRVTESLAGLAVVAAGQGQPERALRLGAATARLREEAETETPPSEQTELDRALASARETLGEAAATAASSEGQAMGLEEAVAYALERDRD